MRKFTYWVALCCISMLLSVGNLFADTVSRHFTTPETGHKGQWQFSFSGAKLDGISLVSGDEIAVFNVKYNKLVGHFVIKQECTHSNANQNNLYSYGTLLEGPDGDKEEVLGFEEGDQYEIQCWDSSANKVYKNPTITWFKNWGTKYESDVFPKPQESKWSIADLDFASKSPGTISGTVFENDGTTALPNADVILSDDLRTYQTKTDEDGKYSQAVFPGTYKVSAVYSSKFDTTRVSTTVGSNKTKTANVTMDLLPGSISGVVKDHENKPVEGVYIFAKNGSLEYTDTTDVNGSYKIERVKVGEYTLTHSPVDGYRDIVKEGVDVETNRNYWAEFKLVEKGAPVKGIVINNKPTNAGMKNPLSQVKVSIGDLSMVTSAGGVFNFEDVSLGKHILKLEKDRFYTEEYEIEVKEKGVEVDLGNVDIYPYRFGDVNGNPLSPVWTLFFKKVTGDSFDLPAGTELAVCRGSRVLGVYRFEKPLSAIPWEQRPVKIFSDVVVSNEWDRDNNGTGDGTGDEITFKVALKGNYTEIATLNKDLSNEIIKIDESVSTYNPKGEDGKFRFPLSDAGKMLDGAKTVVETINFDVSEAGLIVNVSDSTSTALKDTVVVELFQSGKKVAKLQECKGTWNEKKLYTFDFDSLGQGIYDVRVSGYFYDDFWTRNISLNIAEEKEINVLIEAVAIDSVEVEMKAGYQLFSRNLGDWMRVSKLITDGGIQLKENGDVAYVRNENAVQLYGDGKFVGEENPNFGTSALRGYLFKNRRPTTLKVKGIQWPYNYPIKVNNWNVNLVSYLPQGKLDAKTAFSSILDSVEYIRDDEGNQLQKVGTRWINNIGACEPGKAYIVVLQKTVKNSQTLVYPSNGTKSAFIEDAEPTHFVCYGGNPARSVLQLYVEADGLEAGDEIAAFCNGEIVGSTVVKDPADIVRNNIPAFSDFIDRVGYRPGQQIEFKAYDVSEGVEIALNIVEVVEEAGEFANNSLLYPSTDGKYTKVKISAGTTGVISDLEASLMVYPNPATTELNISTAAPAKKVELFNTLGQCVYSVTPDSEQVSINVEGLDQGVYLLRLNYNDGIIVRKVSVK